MKNLTKHQINLVETLSERMHDFRFSISTMIDFDNNQKLSDTEINELKAINELLSQAEARFNQLFNNALKF